MTSRRVRQLARAAERTNVADLTEKQFQAWIIERAAEHGWRLHFHVLRAQVEGRWVTNTSSRGVPDLWLARRGRLVVLEVKAWDGRPTPEQREWIATLQTVAGVEAFVVSPRDADAVLELLADT